MRVQIVKYLMNCNRVIFLEIYILFYIDFLTWKSFGSDAAGQTG